MARESRRSLPLNPYADRPLSEWQRLLEAPGSVEERYHAWLAVTGLSSPEDIWELMIETLSDPEPELRAATAHWMASVINRQSFHPPADLRAPTLERLTGLLTDGDPDVRFAVVEAHVALGECSPPVAEVVLSLIQDPATETTSLAGLVRLTSYLPMLAPELVARLGQWLTADSAELREAAAQTLAVWGPRSSPAVTALIVALDDEEPVVREAAAKALGHQEAVDDEWRHALQAACADEDPGVAAAAQEALSRHGGLP
jgi:HEAT repeat protein